MLVADRAVDEDAAASGISVDLHDEAQCRRRRHRRLGMRPRERGQLDLDGLAIEVGVDHLAAAAQRPERLVSHLFRIDLDDSGGDGALRRRVANHLVVAANPMDAVSGDREHGNNHGGLPELTEDTLVISPLASRGHTVTPYVCLSKPPKSITTG